MAQAAYRRVLSPRLLADVRAMGREYDSRLWSNPFSAPMRAEAGRGFRETYGGASLAWHSGRHALKAGGEGFWTRLGERLAWQITEEGFFDEDLPARFEFADRGSGSAIGGYVQDLAKSAWGRLRLEGNVYRRRTRHFSDDSPLLNTGFSFPIAFAEAEIQGAETRIELPEWRLGRRFSERILSRVDFRRGRVRPQFSLDAAAGILLRASERGKARIQVDIWNLTGRPNVINFSGVFSGTAVGRPRSLAVRLTWEF
jgi:hypothetical protein